jgi:hypothetical protein
MNANAVTAIRALADAIVTTVREAGPLGAPAGVLFAAMSAHGFTKDQYDQFMAALVGAGKLRREGDLYIAR